MFYVCGNFKLAMCLRFLQNVDNCVCACCIVGPHALATAENDWQALSMRHIPPWMLVSDQLVLENYIQGESSLYLKPHLIAWLYPALIWSAFTICLVLVMLGLTLALSSRWVSREKLSYPVIQLPLRMVQNNFWNNRLMWIEFIVGAQWGFSTACTFSCLFCQRSANRSTSDSI